MLLSRRSSEWLAVAIGLVVGSAVFFEIIAASMPAEVQGAIDNYSAPFGWVAGGAVGLSLLCGGVGSLAISAGRLLANLYRSPGDPPRAAIKEHLWSSALVIVGFVLTTAAWTALT